MNAIVNTTESRTFTECKHREGEEFIQKQFGKILIETDSFFANTEHLRPSAWLNETLEIALPLVKQIRSEQARSAFVISNIVLELYKHCNRNFAVYTEQKLNIGVLSGKLDYVMGRGDQTFLRQRGFNPPITVVIEVKSQTLSDNRLRFRFGQCMAEMVAMQFFNIENDSEVSTIYGVLTDAERWYFMKLTDDEFQADTRIYQIENELQLILGILDAMIRDEL